MGQTFGSKRRAKHTFNLASSLGMTSETSNNTTSRSSSEEKSLSLPKHFYTDILTSNGKNESRTKLFEYKQNFNSVIVTNNYIPKEIEPVVPQNSTQKNKSSFKFIDFIDPNIRSADIAPNKESSVINKKPDKGKMRYWLMEHNQESGIKSNSKKTLSRTRRQDDRSCDSFKENERELVSPGWPGNYTSNVDCITTISAPSVTEDYYITMDFRDKFHIEYFLNCSYDFLEIRDGDKGYADLIGKFCGDGFPNQITSQGPNLWIRFKSDSTIEYEGFRAVINFNKSSTSKKPIKECSQDLPNSIMGYVTRVGDEYTKCEESSKGRVDAVWKINVKDGYKIFLNFTHFQLAFPNECRKNFVEVFSEKTDMTGRLKYFCGSMADTVVSTGNVLHVRFVAALDALPKTNFTAHYTAFRSSADDGKPCDKDDEFDCDDATCIDSTLLCDGIANCRLKGDEDAETCTTAAESPMGKTHIIIILVIFSLIFSGMSFVFVYKCIKKLVADHKLIKEHIRQSCEDRLDAVGGSKLTLDPRKLQREFMERERESLRRDNLRNNEMYKRQRSKHLPGSIDSDDPSETHIDIDDDSWPLDIEDNGNINIKDPRERSKSKDRRESNQKFDDKDFKSKDGKETRSKRDINRKDTIDKKGKVERKETIDRKDTLDRKDSHKDSKDKRGTFDKKGTQDRKDSTRNAIERKGTIDRKGTLDRKGTIDVRESSDHDVEDIDLRDHGKRNVSVSFPDTKESGCQTRESLFQGGNEASSDGTESSGTRGFSTFGYSGASLQPARSPHPSAPSAPPPGFTVELLHACKPTPQPKKTPDRRPMSTETTRSAPDVIIVSKPVR